MIQLFFTPKTLFTKPLDPGRNRGKTNPLNDADLAEFIEKQATFADSEKSWSVDVAEIDATTWDLSVKNPNVEEEAPLRAPDEIIAEIRALDAESGGILEKVEALVG